MKNNNFFQHGVTVLKTVWIWTSQLHQHLWTDLLVITPHITRLLPTHPGRSLQTKTIRQGSRLCERERAPGREQKHVIGKADGTGINETSECASRNINLLERSATLELFAINSCRTASELVSGERRISWWTVIFLNSA